MARATLATSPGLAREGTPDMRDSTHTRVPAIETEYAGCRFRSRLEARWAVVLDTLGIRWEYEAQGYEVGWRLTLREGKFNYLPDFWLPDLNMWAEVKGDWTTDECDRFLNAAAELSAPAGGCGEYSVAILGPIPARTQWQPWVLHMHKGDLNISPWPGGCYHDTTYTIARDVGGNAYGEVGTSIEEIATLLLGGWHNDPIAASDIPWQRALLAGRRARFEFGQTPKVPHA